MSGGEMSGVDLARVALRAALEAARNNGSNTHAVKPKPWTTSVVRSDGREPMELGAAIGALVTERAWELPAAGATLRERWEAIAPELAGHVFAVGYDPDSGRLTVCPESSAWATEAWLEQTRVIAAASASVGRTVPADHGARRGVGARADRRRPGARGRARRAAAYPGDRLGRLPPRARRAPGGGAAVPGGPRPSRRRQTAAMRALSLQAFPESDEPAPIEAPREQRRRKAAATEAAALRRARHDRAARGAAPTADVPQRHLHGAGRCQEAVGADRDGRHVDRPVGDVTVPDLDVMGA
ncbi:DUF721 domain-containing protein [Streptomyces sp. NPDC003247]|uniref:DUF721 domain-containing protein n=1 Tax=Streptomyces sp. NPDC003247 TaxID=3364677 RepID=UPI00368F9216